MPHCRGPFEGCLNPEGWCEATGETCPWPERARAYGEHLPGDMETGLVTAEVAAEMLGVSINMVSKLGVAGTLPRKRVPGRRGWLYPSAAVAERAAERTRTYRKPPRHLFHWGPRDRPIEHKELLTSRQVAETLGVSRDRVCQMAHEGLLPCYQKEPGKGGSRLLFPAISVALLAQRESYRVHHQRAIKGMREPTEVCGGWEERGIEPASKRGETRKSSARRGPLLTTRQVAEMLGVSGDRVRKLVRAGRLCAIQRRRKMRPEVSQWRFPYGPRWYLFHPSDVEALLADPEYQRLRDQYRRAHSPEAEEARAAQAAEACLRANKRLHREPWYRDTDVL